MDKGVIRRDIKQNAKLMLRGNMGAAIGIMFINIGLTAVIMMVINSVSYAVIGLNMGTIYRTINPIYSVTPDILWICKILAATGLMIGLTFLVSLFISMPLAFGTLDWYRELSNGNRKSVGAIFDYFGSGKLYIKALKVSLEYTVKLFCLVLACGIGFALLIIGNIFLGIWLGQAIGEAFSWVITGLFTTIIYVSYFLALIMVEIRYTLIVYTSIRNKEWKNRQVFKIGTRYIRGHFFETFAYELSFLGWYILTWLTCGILVIYVGPYKSAADILYYNYLFESGVLEDSENAEEAESTSENKKEEPWERSEPENRVEEFSGDKNTDSETENSEQEDRNTEKN